MKYEWLAGDRKVKSPLGFGIVAYYGLFINGELIGANCIGKVGGKTAEICGKQTAKKTVGIMRGACVPHAPKNAASFFISNTCRQAYKDFGWQVFFAYSDSDAGEIGTVYQAANWRFLGVGVGRGKTGHKDYISPDGKIRRTSYQLNHDTNRLFLRSLGWHPSIEVPMRHWLRSQGWTEVNVTNKGKWVWFEGTSEEKQKLAMRAQKKGYKFLPYPKRLKIDGVVQGNS